MTILNVVECVIIFYAFGLKGFDSKLFV